MRGNGLLAVRMAGSLRPRLSPLAGSAAQNIIAGNGVGISHELISLEITSPEVPDLTLIDLPGIARVAVGNQPQDIGVQVRLSGTGVRTQLRGGRLPWALHLGDWAAPQGPTGPGWSRRQGPLTLRVEARGVAHAPADCCVGMWAHCHQLSRCSKEARNVDLYMGSASFSHNL